MIWSWIILVIGLIYIGVDYGRMVYQARVKPAIEEVYQFEPYAPVRHIFVAQQGNKYIEGLILTAIRSRTEAGQAIKSTFALEDKSYTRIWFEGGDEIISIRYQEDMFIARLEKNNITDYINRLFFDEALPDGAIRNTIAQLGLENYMFSFGLVGKGEG